MPSDIQLTAIYNKLWREEYRYTPIKEIFLEKYNICMSKVASMELKEVGWYDNYLNSLQPMKNYNNYRFDSINALPIGIPERVVIISGCGSDTGECNLVLPTR